MYDLIGDIHGRANELETLLRKLGYHQAGYGYRHDSRQVIFLGDFIDRGPHQRRVLDIVRPMVDGGAALAVMGNHEFNAIAYHTPDGNGGYLRARNSKNTNQHRAFLDEYADKPNEWAETIAWFKKLPLWLEEALDRQLAVYDGYHDIRSLRSDGAIDDQQIAVEYAGFLHGFAVRADKECCGRPSDQVEVEVELVVQVIVCGAWEARWNSGGIEYQGELGGLFDEARGRAINVDGHRNA
jgi:hypothetical protein